MNPHGGSEQETLMLYSLLQIDCNVHLWATSSRASKELLHSYPIKKISILRGSFPMGGVYIFLGAHWRNKCWPALIIKPSRLIYVFNTFHHRIASLINKHPFWLKWPEAEIVLISSFQSNILNIEGVVHPSPIDISRFRPKSKKENKIFTIGRVSRDTADKHNIEDLAVYNECLSLGYKIHIQGGSILKNQLPASENLVLTPEGSMPAEQFMHELDVFYYRTGSHVETFGRVVLEAMASGKPVVCHYNGGYAEHIEHGENGFLFRTSLEAIEIINSLYSDVCLRNRIGMAGRVTAEILFSKEAISKRVEFYQTV